MRAIIQFAISAVFLSVVLANCMGNAIEGSNCHTVTQASHSAGIYTITNRRVCD